jgi:hypothetical protein
MSTVVGYAGTLLPKKPGIKEGPRFALWGAPDGFDDMLGVALCSAAESTRVRGEECERNNSGS